MNHLDAYNGLKLTETRGGSVVRIAKISGGEMFREKLLSMGLLPGKDIEVLSVRKKGPVIVKINDTRIVIGHGMASKIFISPAQGV
jgi:Fe2+ transport system protein FeoA